MFYDVKQLSDNCYFRIKRTGEGNIIYSNIISYEFQQPPITLKSVESQVALNKEITKVHNENSETKDVPLISQKQQSGKWVHAAAMQSDFDPTNLQQTTDFYERGPSD